MTDTYTPGPWRSISDVIQGFTTCRIEPPYDEYRGSVASIQDCHHIGGIGADEALANGRLIAAAPDLLAACRAIRECPGVIGVCGTEAWSLLTLALEETEGL